MEEIIMATLIGETKKYKIYVGKRGANCFPCCWSGCFAGCASGVCSKYEKLYLKDHKFKEDEGIFLEFKK